ncbi:MAG: hypothetical protein M3033_12560 [Acidobacteriota bacterium]|nr:hypothetical protein [Acidobacteriota bacterium]
MEEKIKQHKAELKTLEESYEKNSSEDLQIKINREKDTILHLTNAQAGNPKQRAQEKSQLAAEATRAKAVQKAAA